MKRLCIDALSVRHCRAPSCSDTGTLFHGRYHFNSVAGPEVKAGAVCVSCNRGKQESPQTTQGRYPDSTRLRTEGPLSVRPAGQ